MEFRVAIVRYLVCGLLILLDNFELSHTLSTQIILYPRGSMDDPIIFLGEKGVLFNTNKLDIPCVCITGLWAFYSPGLKGPILIAGGQQEYCLSLKQEISHVVLLSSPSGDSNANTLVVLDSDLNEMKGGLEFENIVSYDDKKEQSLDLPTGYIITVGDMPYTLARSSEACLVPNKTEDTALYYCIFRTAVSLKEKDNHIRITPNCNKDAKMENPVLCEQYHSGFGYCPEMEVPQTRNNHIKRSIKQNQRKLGRVFFGESGHLKNYSFINETKFPYSEDYYIKTLLQLRHHRTRPYKTAAFRLLDLCKRIAQTACPQFLVGDDFYDMAVGSFINLQSKVFKFQETFSDFPTERRITDALNKCLLNFTKDGPYPFLRMDSVNNTYNDTLKVCKKFPDFGAYLKFGKTLEINLTPNFTGINFNPIIDTSWQVVSLVHSACFSYFTAYNDHHQFLNILMQLFTNKAHDLWYKGEDALGDDRLDIYGYVMGSISEAVYGAADCSGFARLESNYPWDLLRPSKSVS